MIIHISRALSSYNKSLQQRNALLKMDDEPDVSIMEIWEEQMAVNGEILYHKRDEFVDLLVLFSGDL